MRLDINKTRSKLEGMGISTQHIHPLRLYVVQRDMLKALAREHGIAPEYHARKIKINEEIKS